MRRGVGGYAQSSGMSRGQLTPAQSHRQQPDPYSQFTQNCAAVARFFVDLRRALGMTPTQAALSVSTRVEVIDALENGKFEMLPPWPETTRVVLAYTARAGVDGRPVLGAMSTLIASMARKHPSPAQSMQPAAPAPRRPRSAPLRRAGTALAAGAKHVRARPDRAFYAVSLPLGVVLLALNTSVLSHAAKSFGDTGRWVLSSVHEIFPIVRDGFRWIEVEDPRSRRGDKLHTPGQ